MTYIRLRSILLVAIAILLFGSGMVQATEQQQRASEEPSLLERYTSNAQDLILKGLELVGIKYRRGGTDPDIGLDSIIEPSSWAAASGRARSAWARRASPDSSPAVV